LAFNLTSYAERVPPAIADAINEAHSKVKNVSVILEIMAGGGNTVGKTFEELKMIIDGVQDKGTIFPDTTFERALLTRETKGEWAYASIPATCLQQAMTYAPRSRIMPPCQRHATWIE